MIPKFRVYDELLKEMYEVSSIEFDTGKIFYKAYGIDGYWNKGAILMQSTGLKDKNGVEIFEGDIVKITVSDGFDYLDGNLSIVKKSDFHAGIICELLSNDLEYLITDESETGYRYEVVGNIYENPELLEVKP